MPYYIAIPPDYVAAVARRLGLQAMGEVLTGQTRLEVRFASITGVPVLALQFRIVNGIIAHKPITLDDEDRGAIYDAVCAGTDEAEMLGESRSLAASV